LKTALKGRSYFSDEEIQASHFTEEKTTMKTIRMFRVLALAALSILTITACGDDNTALAPQFEPEVVNLPDSYEFQATDLTGISQVLTYTWENTGISANVDQSSSISNGIATIVVTDSQGAPVYSGDLTNDGTFQTQEGIAGTWLIRVTLTGVSGTINFRLQKLT
jgi:hypothetical protein